jgi:SAM-dependent methyltransferase
MSKQTFLTSLSVPQGSKEVPQFDRGWIVNGGSGPEPFLSYMATTDPNWSAQLEDMHEESSRDHFIDVWTRKAMFSTLDGVASDASIVDLGCSSGYLLEDLRQRYPDAFLVGIDLVEEGLRKAHKLVPDAALISADACFLPLGDKTVDVVMSANLLEHIEDDQQALREIKRVLRPGGIATIVVPANPGLYDYYDKFLGHERRYRRGEMVAKAKAIGLETIVDCYLGSLLYPPFWFVKKRNRRRYPQLTMEQIQSKVASDIAKTKGVGIGSLACYLEEQLLNRRIHLPFGIRCLTCLRNPR